MVLHSLVISLAGFDGILLIPARYFLEITYSLLHFISDYSLNNGWFVYNMGHVISGNTDKDCKERCAL